LRNPIADFVAVGGCVAFVQIGQWQAFDASGHRKYLTAEERLRFLAIADHLPADRRALCYLLAFAGCRISEALGLTRHQVDGERSTLTFRTLKRRRLVFRTVPVPRTIPPMLLALPEASDGRLWTIHRATAWRMVRATMEAAAILGPMHCCKGLRHGFGITAASCGVPPNLIAKWLGHASLSTTAIYLDAVGQEEREFAERMWR
jgi:integrase/recombinase XerD